MSAATLRSVRIYAVVRYYMTYDIASHTIVDVPAVINYLGHRVTAADADGSSHLMEYSW